MLSEYKYRAVAADGRKRTGTVTADGEAGAEEFLRSQDLLPIDIQKSRAKKATSPLSFFKGANYEELILFTNSLATLHRSGIPLLRALSIIRIGKEESRFNFVLDKLRLGVQSGKLLSEAMSEYPDIFSKVYLSCVAAGEESGQLEATLDELAGILERDMLLTRQIKSGVRYPLMVITAIIGAFLVLMNFVIPKFVNFYEGFDAELPLPTQIIISISNIVTGYWPVGLALVILAIVGLRALLAREDGRLWFDSRLLGIPVFGKLITLGNVARFATMFRILIMSGLSIVKSVTILSDTVKNTAIAKEIQQLGELFRQGKEIDVSSAGFRFFPRQALHMLSIGLESGHLDVMLHEVGDLYTKRVLYMSRHLTAIIEPILTLVIGAFILILALAIFLPMWNLIKVFQG